MSWPVTTRRDQHNRVLIWIEAKDRETGAPSALGIWDGRDHQEFEIDGEVRAFFGAGNIQELKAFTSEAGVVIQNYSLNLAAFSPEVRELVRGRDVRFVRAQIHLAQFDPSTGALTEVSRIFSGVVDGASENIGAIGGEAATSLKLVSNARLLTRKVPVLKSHAAQSKRGGDAFFRHADVSGSVPVFWNRERHRN
jgi:hypothetical protein